MIVARGVHKHYGSIHAVDGVDLDVQEGELFGLIGHNGAGKSTMFKMMLGLIPVTAGDIHIDGAPVGSAGGDFRAVRRKIGYLPESVVLYDNLTGLETLHFFSKLKGVSPWFNPYVGALVNRADALLAPDWVGSMSAFARWDHITTDGVTYKYTGYDKVSAAAAKAHKPWALMVILGSQGSGLPGHVLSGVPAKEWIETDGERFPVFWSPKANAFLQSTLAKLAARYSADPWLAQVRVIGFWSINGEPWFAGGDSGKPKWCNAWRATHPADAGLSDDATLVKVKAAYQAQELAWWAAAAAMWPSHIALAQAAGDGLYDNALSPSEWEQPGRHPARLATWTTVRNLYGARSVFQFNGVNGGDGASGYQRWLPNAFGPVSPSAKDAIVVPAERRGRIGSQPVGGINKETIVGGLPKIRLTFAQAVAMLRDLPARKYSYCEVYGTDVAAAIDGNTADWVKVRNVMIEQKGNWYP